MIKEFCDRCGKEITGKIKRKIIAEKMFPIENMCDASGNEHYETVVCTDCYNDFKEFMKL